VLAAVKLALLGSIVAAGWADAATSTGTAVPPVVERRAGDGVLPGAPGAGPGGPVLQRELDVHRCSVSGFPDGRTPRSALVRTATGRLRHVSFDAGWRVYTTHGAARLVAVCLDRPAGPLPG
jgi:hypothetical protein